VTDIESPFMNVGALVGVPTVLPEAAVGPLFTWPTMTAPLCPTPLRKDGAVGEKEASSAQEIGKTAKMTRSRPRSGVLFIDPPEHGSSATPVPVRFR